jgi:membrane associated rhomboid family serine protease
VNVAGSDISTVVIEGPRRQIMDWSLVLASQDIPATLTESENKRWGLILSSADHTRALEAIRLYQLENRRWRWRQPIRKSEETFHWGSLAWCILIILVHWLTLGPLFDFRAGGQFDSHAAAQGQWWRAFTAILLHADLAHLLANCTIGFLLLGLAMARYGAALALLAAYLAGALGNVAGLLAYSKPYWGMGASGMVMGALGLIAVPPWRSWSRHPHAIKQVVQAAFASILLFVLLGVDRTSDVMAHLGGFVSGAVFGLLLNLVPAWMLKLRAVITGLWVILLALFVGTFLLALSHMTSA